MRTHYDNLKVSKDAPVEVIQAAYRTLAKKYHPDINKNNPEAVRIMQIINDSYEVL
ncbi:J domain-containing protein, partial [Klebsiella pneumoniae]